MNGYKAFYGGKTEDVVAETLYAAKQEAIKRFKAPKKKEHMVTVMLWALNVDPETGEGTPIVHIPDF